MQNPGRPHSEGRPVVFQRMGTTTGSGDRTGPAMLHSLTGLRLFAAAWVAAYHFRSDLKTLFPITKPVWPLLDAGYAGVDLFFILSGFIISYVYLRSFQRPSARRYLRFLWLRLARIWPLHLATLAIFYVVMFPGSLRELPLDALLSRLDDRDLWGQVFLVHAWGREGNISWNFPAWSISVEWFAYLVFPFAALFLVKVQRPSGMVAGVLAALAFNVVSFLLLDWSGYGGKILLLRILGEFGAGAFLFLLWERRMFAEMPWHVVTPLAAGAAVLVTSIVAHWHYIAPVVSAPLYVVTILGLAYQSGWLDRFLAHRLCVYGGEVSYALYMTHAVCLRFLWSYFPTAAYTDESRLVRAGVLLFYAFVVAATAVVAYHLIEKPARAAMRRVIEPPRAAVKHSEEPMPQVGERARPATRL